MADRIITNSERGMTVTVNDIEHIESQWSTGCVIKIFFQPQANIQTALAQVTAIVQTTVRGLPLEPLPAGHQLLGIFDADCPTRHQQQDHAGAATVRPRPEFHSQPVGHRAGAATPYPMAAKSARYR